MQPETPSQPTPPAGEPSAAPTPPINPMPPNPPEVSSTPSSTQESANYTKLPSAFKLFGKSMHAWGVNFKTYILLFLLMCIPIALLVFVVLTQFASKSATSPYAASASGASTGLNVVSVVIGLIAFFLLLALGFIVLGASYKVQIASVREQKMGFKEAFNYGKRYGIKIVGLGILFGLVVMLGTLLLIIPGIFMMKRYYLSFFYLVDKDMGIRQAMDASAADSKTFSSAVWGLLGVLFLISILSSIPVIGLAGYVVSLLYAFAPAVRYAEIQNAKKV